LILKPARVKDFSDIDLNHFPFAWARVKLFMIIAKLDVNNCQILCPDVML